MKRLTQTLVLCLLTAFPALAQKTMYPKYGFPTLETANTKIRFSMPTTPTPTLAAWVMIFI